MPFAQYPPTVLVSANVVRPDRNDDDTGGNSCMAQPQSALVSLPTELLLHVLSWLDAGELRAVVAATCRRLRSLLDDEAYWRWRAAGTHRFAYYPQFLVNGGEWRWWRACAALDRESRRWARYRSGTTYESDYVLPNAHYGTVDALHLLTHGRTADSGTDAPLLCVTGARDRNLIVWNLHALGESGASRAEADTVRACRVADKSQAHDGWIWSIASESNERLVTGGWDNHVRWWHIRDDGRLEETGKCKLATSVLCVVPFDGGGADGDGCSAEGDNGPVVIASRFDHTISVLDRRADTAGRVVAEWKCHRGSVLGLAPAGGNGRVFSCADDRSLCCVDARVGRPVSSRTLPQYATSLSYGGGCLWASTNRGYICMVDPNRDTLPTVVSLRVSERGRSVPQVLHTLGSIVCVAGADRRVDVLPFGRRRAPQLAAFGGFAAEPVRLDYDRVGGTLACGMSDGSIAVWTR